MRYCIRTCLNLVIIGAAIVAISGCGRRSSKDDSFLSAPSTSSVTKKFRLRGTVVRISPQTDELTVRHGDIPGFMPAMTMIYKIKHGANLLIAPGDQIEADVLVQPSSEDYLLDDIVVSKISSRDDASSIAVLAPRQLELGASAPDVPLRNQDGKTVHIRNYRGKALLITFIYTRCPMPTACPLITSHFARVNSELLKDSKAYAGSHLISISLDPNYDTPAVLRRYGLAYLDGNSAAFAHWEFACAAPNDLRRLAEAFGLEYVVEDNQIAHSMRTILMGPDNKVAQSWDGSAWEPDAIADAVKTAAYQGSR